MTREHAPRPDEEQLEFREESASLVRITAAPVVWAGHFLVCYCAVALVCAKGWQTGWLQPALLAVSLGALAVIAWLGFRSFRQWDVRNTGDFSNPHGEAEDRHQFLGHAAFLLAIVSAVGVVYVTLPILMIGVCR
ncbi:MAG: hypothetical protein MUE98_06325 [Rhodobacteraceae bacterium]|jgi:hypothetical protein|nr:hypothetical protein [Paracoccaceae bacterium]